MKKIFFDLETTGVVPKKDRIVSMCIITDDAEYNYLINPTVPIPKEASNVHGITNEMVANAPTFKDLATQIFDIVNPDENIWIGYNSISFDNVMLVEEFKRCGIFINIENVQAIDVYKNWVAMEKRTLTDAYRHFCNKEIDNAHNATYDVRATKEIFEVQQTKYQDIDFVQLNKAKTDTSSKLKKDNSGDLIFLFGKHKDKSIRQIIIEDLKYLSWLCEQEGFSQKFKSDIKNEVKRIKGI